MTVPPTTAPIDTFHPAPAQPDRTAVVLPPMGPGSVSVIPPPAPRMSLLPSKADYEVYLELAERFIESGFLPAAITTPAQALAIMLTGRELGLPPMLSLRMIHVVDGKPGMASELILARFRQAGGRHRWLETNAQIARIQLIAPGDSPDWAQTFQFTIEEAKRAEVTGKKNWQKYPAAMLRARVASLAVRAVAPEVSSGLHDPDELGAVTSEAGEVEQWPEPEQRREPTERAHTRTEVAEARGATATIVADDPVLPIEPYLSQKIPLSQTNIGAVLGFLWTCQRKGLVEKYADLIQKAMASFPVKLRQATAEQLSKTAKWIVDDEARRLFFASALPEVEHRLEELTVGDEDVAAPEVEAMLAAAVADMRGEPMEPVAAVVGRVAETMLGEAADATRAAVPVVHDDDLAALVDDLPTT